MFRILAVLLLAFSLVDSGTPVKYTSQIRTSASLGFAFPGPGTLRQAPGLLEEATSRPTRPWLPGSAQRSSQVHFRLAKDIDTSSLYGPVVVEDPQTHLPVLRVSRRSDSVDPLDGCEDVKLVNTIGWGDGHHATTRLCLDFLARHAADIRSKAVLDYGTGSGVLGIAACKLGCENVIGVDIDDEAIDAAYENFQCNSLDEAQMTLCHTREIVQDLDGIQLRDEPARAAIKFDVVIANILIGPLMKLAPVLSLCVKDDTGLLCLCGLREEQLPALEAEYSKYGVVFHSVHTRRHEQWREGAEGEGVWAQVTARKRALSDTERKALLDDLNDRAVS